MQANQRDMDPIDDGENEDDPSSLKRRHSHHSDGQESAAIETDAPPEISKRAKSTPPPPLPILPEEILVEILCRLPVKSLIQYSCVCKSFKTLISCPQFIKTHLKKITNLSRNKPQPNFHQKLAIATGGPLFSISLYSLFHDPVIDTVEFEASQLKDKRYFDLLDWLVGTCDGLLCLSIGQEALVLWNPSTRAFNRLPDFGVSKKCGCYKVYGFGYDRKMDDYKVVGIFCYVKRGFRLGERGGYVARVKVFSLRSNCWKEVGEFGYGYPYDVAGKYLNDCLCWPAMHGTNRWTIVSFDLSKDTYDEVLQPDYAEKSDKRELGVLEGWLCVMCSYNPVCEDVWVMKEFGVRESWTKLFTIPYLEDPEELHYSLPIYISDDGEVLLEFGCALVIFNPKLGTIRYPRLTSSRLCFEAEMYIETLVSPVPEN